MSNMSLAEQVRKLVQTNPLQESVSQEKMDWYNQKLESFAQNIQNFVKKLSTVSLSILTDDFFDSSFETYNIKCSVTSPVESLLGAEGYSEKEVIEAKKELSHLVFFIKSNTFYIPRSLWMTISASEVVIRDMSIVTQ